MGHALVLLKDVLGDRLSKSVTSGSTELVNGGVEAGVTAPVGWNKVTWAGSATFAWDKTVSHSGTYSLKLVPNATGYGPGLYPGQRIAVGQSTYQYRSWVKMESVTGSGVYMTMLFYDSSGNFLVEKKFYPANPTGTNDWQQIVGQVTTPANATQFEMYLGNSGTGTAWFDDVACVDTNAVVPPVRQMAYADVLKESRDHWRQHMLHYSNQVQICTTTALPVHVVWFAVVLQ